MAWIDYVNEVDPWDCYECDEDFIPNRLFHHGKIFFDSILAETDKAYLLKINSKMDLWIPKKICKHMTLNKEDYMSYFVYVHTKTYNSIVKRYKEMIDDE